MSTAPLIAALPQFGGGQGSQDQLVASSPVYQALLSQTGGNLQNVNSLAASQPGFGQALSLMSPGGGLNPAQANQFGPLFGLLMSLYGQQTPGSGGQ
jgi:hypothetical protein